MAKFFLAKKKIKKKIFHFFYRIYFVAKKSEHDSWPSGLPATDRGQTRDGHGSWSNAPFGHVSWPTDRRPRQDFRPETHARFRLRTWYTDAFLRLNPFFKADMLRAFKPHFRHLLPVQVAAIRDHFYAFTSEFYGEGRNAKSRDDDDFRERKRAQMIWVRFRLDRAHEP